MKHIEFGHTYVKMSQTLSELNMLKVKYLQDFLKLREVITSRYKKYKLLNFYEVVVDIKNPDGLQQ